MYAFDPALDAKAVLKERFVWMLFMGALFFLLYGAANQYAHLGAPHPSLFMEWERQIPFVPAFIVPYMSSDLLFCIAFLMPYTRFELRVLAARVLFIIAVSVALFMLFPLQYGFEKPEIRSFTLLFGMLEADLPYNQLPSLHIAFAVVLWASMRSHLKNPLLKAALAGWFWLVAASTLLVYQHHFVDLPAGAALGFAACFLVASGRQTVLTAGFTTPRSIKMGLYYLAGAALCLVGAFAAGGIAALFLLWCFASMLAVSVVYAFGLNDLICGRAARPNPLQWVLFFPYFAGNHLSWRYYRRRVPLMAHVGEHLYMGRYPEAAEYGQLEALGIGRTINLAPEQQFHNAGLPQQRLAFLDQTIQSPEALHRAVEAIGEPGGGGVYVHCALGLSRSVLVASAWMLSRGMPPDEVERVMGTIRPGAVRSPYMRIALDLYRVHLQEIKHGAATGTRPE